MKEFLREKQIQFKDGEITSIVQGIPQDSEKKCNKKALANLLFNSSMEEFILNQKRRASPERLFIPEYQDNLSCLPEMQRVLNKIDASIFDKKITHFQFYKLLDQDKDGYVSGNDICEYLVGNNIVTQCEAHSFLKQLGVKKDQFLYHKDFHGKVYENFSNLGLQSEKENQRNIMGLKDQDPEKLCKKVQDAKEFFSRLKESYRVRDINDNFFCY